MRKQTVGYGKALWGCRNLTGIYVQDKQGVSKCTSRNCGPKLICYGDRPRDTVGLISGSQGEAGLKL
jgi:hypothetical protein